MGKTLRKLTGLVLAMAWLFALPAQAETLGVLRGDINTAVYVPIDSQEYIVIPSGFCEMAVADPGIADISSPSSTLARVDGIATGRTSLAIFDCEGGTISIVEILVASNAAAGKGPFYAPEMLSGEQIAVVKNVAVSTLKLPASVSVILETDLPAAGFKLDDTDIADAARLGATSFYILGKSVGMTTIYLQHENGVPPTVVNIEVIGDVDHSS